MTNQNEDPQVTTGADNEAGKLEWEQRMAQFKIWLDDVRGMLEFSKGREFAKLWMDLVHDFYQEAQEVLGLSDDEMRTYAVTQVIIGGTVDYTLAPKFDLPNGEIEALFRQAIAKKQIEVGNEGLA